MSKNSAGKVHHIEKIFTEQKPGTKYHKIRNEKYVITSSKGIEFVKCRYCNSQIIKSSFNNHLLYNHPILIKTEDKLGYIGNIPSPANSLFILGAKNSKCPFCDIYIIALGYKKHILVNHKSELIELSNYITIVRK